MTQPGAAAAKLSGEHRNEQIRQEDPQGQQADAVEMGGEQVHAAKDNGTQANWVRPVGHMLIAKGKELWGRSKVPE